MEDKNAGGNADVGGLACEEVSEGSRDYSRDICVLYMSQESVEMKRSVLTRTMGPG